MNDDWISPGHRQAPLVARAPGEAAWSVTKNGRTIGCELRNDERIGAGRDVVIRQDGELSFSRRCADEQGAGYVAHALKQDQINAGWIENGDAR